MSSLVGMIKRRVPKFPRFVGDALAKIPYSYRPGFALSYRAASARRRWFDETATLREKKDYIFQSTRRVVAHAIKNAPFYRRYYAEHGFSLDDLRTFDDIVRIPIVTKETLRDVPLEERSCRRRGRTETYTGGSTGEPFKFYSDPAQIGVEWAHMHYVWSRLGYRFGDLLLSVCFDPEEPPVFYDALRHSISLNVFYPRDRVVEAFLALPKRRRRVSFFRGYPSAIAELLDYCERHAPHATAELRETLQGSFLASEYPFPAHRRLIEGATRKPTISWYGLSERVLLAYERTRPFVYEPMHSYGYCEAVENASGFTTLVGTSYFNFASPLIRYRVDDGVVPLASEDGLLLSFEISEGRLGDYIVDKKGDRFSITHLNLSCREETWEVARCVQVEQREAGKIVLWVTPRRETSIEELRRVFAFDNLPLDCEYRIVERPFVSQRGKTLLKINSAERGSDK